MEYVTYSRCKTEGCINFVATNSGTDGRCPGCNLRWQREKERELPPVQFRRGEYTHPQQKSVSQFPWRQEAQEKTHTVWMLQCVQGHRIIIHAVPHPELHSVYNYYWEIANASGIVHRGKKPSMTWAAAGMHALRHLKGMLEISGHFSTCVERDTKKAASLT